MCFSDSSPARASYSLEPHLTGRFTCHLPSNRGRGLSGDHPDLSSGRLVDDILTYLDGLGQPAGLMGWSAGADLALAAAAQSDTVDAVAEHAGYLEAADHVPDATMHRIPGAGHAGNLTHPEALAEALTGFFAPVQQPA